MKLEITGINEKKVNQLRKELKQRCKSGKLVLKVIEEEKEWIEEKPKKYKKYKKD